MLAFLLTKAVLRTLQLAVSICISFIYQMYQKLDLFLIHLNSPCQNYYFFFLFQKDKELKQRTDKEVLKLSSTLSRFCH